MPRNYQQYTEEITADIAAVLKDASCQPILFIGSGFSKRYAGAPTWDQLLSQLAEKCPLITKSFIYYKQNNKNLSDIASLFAGFYQEWAWGDGRENYPDEYFSESVPSDIFIKHSAAEILKKFPPLQDAGLQAELDALVKLSPHAIVTTNYDELIEPLFPEYERVIGQTILRRPYLSIGEIFKIHGCISDPNSLVLTSEDYTSFDTDKKYLSAKLLTYFAEHPLLFIGYSASDENIKSVLYDVDRMIRANFQLIPNIYILEWDPEQSEHSYPPLDRVLAIGGDREIRIKSITASSFEWVFKAFDTGGHLEQVNMKLLRSLLARTVDLVRTDVPSKRVEVDFKILQEKIGSGENIATLLGITSLDHASKVNVIYPYTLTQVSEKLGQKYWGFSHQLIEQVKNRTGFDIKASDNTYHITLQTGKKSSTNKYSEALVELLKKVIAMEDYELASDCQT